MTDFPETAICELPWATAVFEGVPEVLPRETAFAVVLSGLTYACRFKAHADSEGLLVWVFGSTGATGVRPVLGTRWIGDQINYSTLVIFDPTLLLDPEMLVSVGLGTVDKDPIPGFVALASGACRQLGHDPKEAVFVGSSGGGFTAVQAACLAGAGAITLNAQLDIPSAARAITGGVRVRELFRPGLTFEEWGEMYPVRINVAAAFRDACQSGRNPRLALYQNVVDQYHYAEQFLPFGLQFGVSSDSPTSADNLLRVGTLDYSEGHSAIRSALNYVIEQGAPFVRQRQA